MFQKVYDFTIVVKYAKQREYKMLRNFWKK